MSDDLSTPPDGVAADYTITVNYEKDGKIDKILHITVDKDERARATFVPDERFMFFIGSLTPIIQALNRMEDGEPTADEDSF